MLIRSVRKIEAPKIELIPLLDVFFLILIFFFYSIFHLVEEKGVPVNLASASSATTQQKSDLLIVIDRNGNYFLDGNASSADEINGRFSALDKKSKIIIRSDQDSPVGASIKILNLAREMGIQQVSLQADPATVNR